MSLRYEASRSEIFSAIKCLVRADAETNRFCKSRCNASACREIYPLGKSGGFGVQTRASGGAGLHAPVPSEIHWRDIRGSVKSEIEYTQCRKFVSDAALKFDGDDAGT
jgi:hypothetical protein